MAVLFTGISNQIDDQRRVGCHPGAEYPCPEVAAQQCDIASADDHDVGDDQSQQSPASAAQRGNAVGGHDRDADDEKYLGAFMRLQQLLGRCFAGLGRQGVTSMARRGALAPAAPSWTVDE